MRITKVYTRIGDDGTTGLSKGDRLAKNSPRIVVFGSLDEMNALIGMVLAEKIDYSISEALNIAQNVLFNIGGELALIDESLNLVRDKDVTTLENAIDNLNETLAPLEDFVYPRGSRATTILHYTRAVCRRAERDLVTLQQEDSLNPLYLKYVNRLSDFLFVAARYQNEVERGAEEIWRR